MDILFRMFAACSMLKGGLLDACCLLGLLFDGTADKVDGALRNLLITCRFSVFSWWFQLKSVFLQQILEHYIRLYYDVRY